ncbi:HD-GYP domain-containing protein [Sphingoaurantiacus capsulatus]|uniref:HD-GYP domain-containing protein n=1 Tax=Sphingoaurantiacus capsulatus TaxID=1771310 RepID=A0ABV7X8U6_9SPHN
MESVRRLLAIGAAMSAERDLDRLLEMILLSAKELTGADGGTLFLATDNGHLEAKMLHTSSLGYAMGGSTGTPVSFPPLPIADSRLAAAACARDGATIVIADVYAESAFDFVGSKRFDAENGYRTRSLLCTPMRNVAGETVGVIQLINAVENGEVVAFSDDAVLLAQSLASQGAVSIDNRRLIDQLGSLFEAFVDTINTAVDEKSPYTGNHCKRVPELTLMLADAASAANGPLAEFTMDDADRYELGIAARLHDCGKVTTPVHVVDKATKLETIFDRIALVDARFELLRRDAEIAALRGEIDDAARDALLADLADEQAFLRVANVGGERMRDEDIARVRRIAERMWRDAGGVERPLLDTNELENLTIVAGTLTGAERGIINHHIVATIRMLEALPWPKHLRRVPEFAGGHHERMDGKGYPRGLTRDQMSVPARVMAIADIFEALTADDRPYKSAKPLSESLFILGKMKEGGHVDPDLFDVFIRDKVYARYAERFLPAAQIDAIDEAKIPGYRP